MTKIFKNNTTTLFVTKSDKIEKRGAYSLILSPEFYWIKKVSLPVKKEREALKLAPSVFEGFLPAGEFAYEVRQGADGFIMIAYDKKQINRELEKIITHKGDIKALYFAQDALGFISACVEVNDHAALSNMDGIIIQVPRACTNTDTSLNQLLEKAALGKRRVKLSSFDSELFSLADMKIVATIFGLLFFAFLSEYIAYKKATDSLDKKRVEIIERYDLPRTSIQLKSIKKSLVKKFKKQKNLRDMLFALSKLRLKSGEYIQRIEENPKGMVVKIVLTSKERERAIKAMFPKDIVIKESHVVDNLLTIKVAS